MEPIGGSVSVTWPAAWSADRTLRPMLLDEESFHRLHARLARPLLGYLRRFTGRDSAAQDLAQETWIKLLATPVDASDPDRLRSFVFRVATNLARDRFRRRRRESLFGLRPHREAEIAEPSQERAVEARDLERCLQALRPRERALVLLAHVEGFDHREIAGMLGLRPASVRVLLFRARKRLARDLQRRGLAPRSGS